MLSAIFILNKEAIILIEKQYREKIPRGLIDNICLSLRDSSHPPQDIIKENDYIFLLHRRNDLWFVGVCDGDEFALLPISVLKRVEDLLAFQLSGGLSESTVKLDYPLVYQILDYSVDFGYPFLTEGNAIQSITNRLPSSTILQKIQAIDVVRPWRRPNVKWSRNEALIDVTEIIDVTVSSQGRIEFCHIKGSVVLKTKLSDEPLCKLILSPSTHYEDSCFHRCVETNFDINSKVLTFIPPDGEFTLMNYRLTTASANLPIIISPKFKWGSKNIGGVNFEIAFKPESYLTKPIECAEVRFQLPQGVFTPSLTAQVGSATYDSTTKEVIWNIGSYPKKEPIILNGSASTEAGFDPGFVFPVVSCNFQTHGIAPSGFKIEKLQIENINYKPFTGVKYICISGDYEFRTSNI